MPKSDKVREITLIFDPDIEYNIKVIDQKTGKEVEFDIIGNELID